MKVLKFHILTVAAAALLTSCINQELPECKDRNIALHTRAYGLNGVTAAADNIAIAQIFFWEQDEFDALRKGADDATAKLAKPLYTANVDQDLDEFTAEGGLTFRTSYLYPDGNAPLYATGIAPADAFVFDDTNLFTQIGIAPAYADGKTDLLVSDGSKFITGSYDAPFVKDGNATWNEERELKFRHLTAKLLFVGERSTDMTNNIGVKDVKIRIHDSKTNIVVPKTLQLMTNENHPDYTTDDRRFTYRMTEFYDPAEISLSNVGTINIDEQKHLDSCYVVSENLKYFPFQQTNSFDPFKGKSGNGGMTTGVSGHPTITLDVEATLFMPGDETLDRTEKWVNKTVEITDNLVTGDMLCPGYQYIITITFDRAGITLRAEQVPWEDGGIHVQPVIPKTQSATQRF